MTILQAFERFAQEQNFPYEQQGVQSGGTPSVRFQIEGENGNYMCHGLCSEQDQMFIAFADLNVRVPEERMEKAARYLHRLNYMLKIGGFFRNEEDGSIQVRLSQFIAGTDPEVVQSLVERAVVTCGVIADSYYKEILRELIL